MLFFVYVDSVLLMAGPIGFMSSHNLIFWWFEILYELVVVNDRSQWLPIEV